MIDITTERTLKQEVEKTLRSLHICGSWRGLRLLTFAITQTALDPRRTELITKDLYWDIARRYKTTPERVERNIRRAIQLSWEFSSEKLDQMAGYHLVKRPTNKEFIDIVAFYIRSR